MREVTWGELARHAREDDCWIAIEGKADELTLMLTLMLTFVEGV